MNHRTMMICSYSTTLSLFIVEFFLCIESKLAITILLCHLKGFLFFPLKNIYFDLNLIEWKKLNTCWLYLCGLYTSRVREVGYDKLSSWFNGYLIVICSATSATLFHSVIDFVNIIRRYFAYGLWVCLCVWVLRNMACDMFWKIWVFMI